MPKTGLMSKKPGWRVRKTRNQQNGVYSGKTSQTIVNEARSDVRIGQYPGLYLGTGQSLEWDLRQKQGSGHKQELGLRLKQ